MLKSWLGLINKYYYKFVKMGSAQPTPVKPLPNLPL